MVYFIQEQGKKRIKIGSSVNCVSRLNMLQVGSSEELKLLLEIEGDANTERQLHERFAHLRVRGEWFRARPELLDFIQAADQPVQIRVRKRTVNKRGRSNTITIQECMRDMIADTLVELRGEERERAIRKANGFMNSPHLWGKK